jgi:hypothetical protein
MLISSIFRFSYVILFSFTVCFVIWHKFFSGKYYRKYRDKESKRTMPPRPTKLLYCCLSHSIGMNKWWRLPSLAKWWRRTSMLLWTCVWKTISELSSTKSRDSNWSIYYWQNFFRILHWYSSHQAERTSIASSLIARKTTLELILAYVFETK